MHNSLTVVGHLGQDCTTKIIEGGRSLTQFSVAHTESWKDAQGVKQERTSWFNCSYFTANPHRLRSVGMVAVFLTTSRIFQYFFF